MSGNILKHVAIIMDGNGRWAKKAGKARTEGHKKGAENAFNIAQYAFDRHDIKYVTLYAFSTENWNRPKSEINALFKLLEQFLKKECSKLIENNISLKTIGNINSLPKSTVGVINQVCESTKSGVKNLILALNYGAREEIINAINKITAKSNGKKLESWQEVADCLYTREIPDPDLIVRTSGELRLSNYLLLQSAYSELYFAKEFWPDFDESCLDKAVADFNSRKRRFGKIE